MFEKQLIKTIGAGLATLGFAATAQAEVDAEFSVGYESEYIYRGSFLGNEATWYGLDFSGSCDCGVDWNAGIWSISPDSVVHNDVLASDELDIYVGLSKDLGPGALSLGYTAYTYDSVLSDDQNELYAGYSMEIAGLDVGATYYYGFSGFEQEIAELSVSYGMDLTDCISAELGVTHGYIVKHWNAALEEEAYTNVSLGLSTALSDDMTLSGHVSYAGSDEAWSDYDGVYGGASVSFAF